MHVIHNSTYIIPSKGISKENNEFLNNPSLKHAIGSVILLFQG